MPDERTDSSAAVAPPVTPDESPVTPIEKARLTIDAFRTP